MPSGILNEKCLCLVGNGVVVHLPGMFDELDKLVWNTSGEGSDALMTLSRRAVCRLDTYPPALGAP